MARSMCLNGDLWRFFSPPKWQVKRILMQFDVNQHSVFQMFALRNHASMVALAWSERARFSVFAYPPTGEICVSRVSSLKFGLLDQAFLSRCPLHTLVFFLLCLFCFFVFPDLENCEPGWDKFHGFCYRHFSQRLSWEVAEQHCRVQGAHLASIMTPEEQAYINSMTATHLSMHCIYTWCS